MVHCLAVAPRRQAAGDGLVVEEPEEQAVRKALSRVFPQQETPD